jgi:AraC family transcriptional regulator
MLVKQPLVIDYVDWTKLMPNPPVLSSFSANWSNIQLAHYRLPKFDFPEISNSQNVIVIPLGHETVDFEFIAEGHSSTVSYQEIDFTKGYIQICPADLPISFHSHSRNKVIEFIQCYIEPTFLAQIAHESVNTERVELLLTLKKIDPLICQIGLALKLCLEIDGVGSRFYADSMATALSAHLIRHYSTRNHQFREYEDVLPKHKLKQAIDYIQAHLGENVSLSELANTLGMSQYYFCRLFKQSTGLSPHQYLIHQRIEQAKRLLKNPDLSITFIAMECGFANSSHFAKCFCRVTGMNPKQFRKS